MRRKNCRYLAIVLLVIFYVVLIVNLISVVSAIRINEVMYNPNSAQGGSTNEWIEIHFENSVELSDYILIEKQGTSNRTTKLNRSLSTNPYLIVANNISKFQEMWDLSLPNIIEVKLSLANTGDSIWIYKNNTLIDYVSYKPSFGANGNGKSLQFCDGNWIESEPTAGIENNCKEAKEKNDSNDEENDIDNNDDEDEENKDREINENDKIKIEKKIEEENDSELEENKVIVLNPAKTENIKITQTYLSKAEKMKKYAIYGFIFLCIVFIILLIKVNLKKKLKRKQKKK